MGVFLFASPVLGAENDAVPVRGRTTPAEIEDVLGRPLGVTVVRHGGLALVYSYAQWRRVMAGSAPVVSPAALGEGAGMVSVRFGPDLTYQGVTLPPGHATKTAALSDREYR
jgi:hypothetical protein